MTTDYDCDWIISNPPYSNKDEIIERCIEIGKPTILLLPIESLGGLRLFLKMVSNLRQQHIIVFI